MEIMPTGARTCDAGYRFWLVVHEIQGGTSKAADAAIHVITSVVADRENREAGTVRRELLARVAAVVAGTSARSVHKREARRIQKKPPWSDAVARARADVEPPDLDFLTRSRVLLRDLFGSLGLDLLT